MGKKMEATPLELVTVMFPSILYCPKIGFKSVKAIKKIFFPKQSLGETLDIKFEVNAFFSHRHYSQVGPSS